MKVSNDTVQRALDAEDIEGVLAMGAPADEYESEARMIAGRLRTLEDDLSEDAIVAVIESVWTERFAAAQGDTQMAIAYANVARRILELQST